MICVHLSHSTAAPDTPTLERAKTFSKNPLPAFAAYRPDLKKLAANLKPYQKYRQFILIGRGGSTAPFEAFYESEQNEKTKKVHVLKTASPDRIAEIKKQTKPKNTLVIAISKSGQTVDVLENLFSFPKYPVLAITEFNQKTLHTLAQNQKFGLIAHPPVGGRFSGGTECALAPLALAGIDTRAILQGIQTGHKTFGPHVPPTKNPALALAINLYSLYQNGYDEWFMPIYSPRLAAFSEVTTQLVHESLAKNGKGITIVVSEAPQSQHHSNQRFFGGPANMVGLFVTQQKFKDTKTRAVVPANAKPIVLRNSTLALLEHYPLADAMRFEFEGTYRNATANQKPVIQIAIPDASEKSAGEFYAFMSMLVTYMGWLLGVDPFDQPDVEASKQISEQLRQQK